MNFIPPIAKTHRSSSGTVKSIDSIFLKEKDGRDTLTPYLSERGIRDIDMALDVYFDAKAKRQTGYPASQWRDLQHKANSLTLRVPVGASQLIQDKVKSINAHLLKHSDTARALLPTTQPAANASAPAIIEVHPRDPHSLHYQITPPVVYAQPDQALPPLPPQSLAGQAHAEAAARKTAPKRAGEFKLGAAPSGGETRGPHLQGDWHTTGAGVASA